MSCMTLTTIPGGLSASTARTGAATTAMTTSEFPGGCKTALYCNVPPVSNARCDA